MSLILPRGHKRKMREKVLVTGYLDYYLTEPSDEDDPRVVSLLGLHKQRLVGVGHNDNIFVNEGRLTIIDLCFDPTPARTWVHRLAIGGGSQTLTVNTTDLNSRFTDWGYGTYIDLTEAASPGDEGVYRDTAARTVTLKKIITNNAGADRTVTEIAVYTEGDQLWAISDVTPSRTVSNTGTFTPVWTIQFP